MNNKWIYFISGAFMGSLVMHAHYSHNAPLTSQYLSTVKNKTTQKLTTEKTEDKKNHSIKNFYFKPPVASQTKDQEASDTEKTEKLDPEIKTEAQHLASAFPDTSLFTLEELTEETISLEQVNKADRLRLEEMEYSYQEETELNPVDISIEERQSLQLELEQQIIQEINKRENHTPVSLAKIEAELPPMEH